MGGTSSSHHLYASTTSPARTSEPINNKKRIIDSISEKSVLSNGTGLSKSKLIETVFVDNGDNCSHRAQVLLQNCFQIIGGQNAEHDCMSPADFVPFCELVLEGHDEYFISRSSQTTLCDNKFITLTCPNPGGKPNAEIMRDILLLAYSISIRPAAVVTETDEDFATKLGAALARSFDSIDSILHSWERASLPFAHACRTYFANRLVVASSIFSRSPPQSPAKPRTINTPISAFGLWVLSEMLPATYNPSPPPLSPNLPPFSQWQLLFDSSRDGLSFSRLETLVFDYKSPTLVLFAFGDSIFVAGIDCEWRKGVTKWGGVDCCLIQLLQNFHMVESNPGMVLCNTKDRSAPRGIQFGSRLAHVEIDDGLSEAKLYSTPSSLCWVQVVGCGSLSAQQAQAEYRRLTAEDARLLKEKKLHAVDADDWSTVTQILDWGGVQRGNLAKKYGAGESPEEGPSDTSSSVK